MRDTWQERAIEAVISTAQEPLDIQEVPRAGRPPDDGLHIARLAHFDMCRFEISGEGREIHRRVLAGRALGIGNKGVSDDIIIERQVRRGIKKARRILDECEWHLITCKGVGNPVDGRCWVALANQAFPPYRVLPDGSVEIFGTGWLCEWGEKRARYGLIQGRPHKDFGGTFITVSPWSK